MKKISVLIVFLVVMTELLSGCNANLEYYPPYKNEKSEKPVTDRIYAVWVSYNELSMLNNADKGRQAFYEKADSIMKNCNGAGFNRVIVQVRPFCDAFYYSELFPMTVYLSGVQGKDVGYDALEILCERAHYYNLKIDAWINPYRVSYDSDLTNLADNNPAKTWIEQGRNDDVIIIDKGIFLNPSSSFVQKLVIDGIREIIMNYDVDGIHIDDYFYPVTDSAFDGESYLAYCEKGGSLTQSEWRRENINNMVSLIYSTVKGYDGNLLFTVSPAGDIDKNYNNYYADVRLWASQYGYCDIIMPQLYYGFENENMPFKTIFDEWKSIVNFENTGLCIGMSYYKYGVEDVYAGTGKNEWLENNDIISRQIELVLSDKDLSGFSLFSYSYIFNKKNDEFCKNELQKLKNMIQ